MSTDYCVWQRRWDGWEWTIRGLPLDRAIEHAVAQRFSSYRPVCVAPVGMHPDVAYPEAAR